MKDDIDNKSLNFEHPWRICMVSDFFFPNMGGVETHIYCLSQCLLSLGHKVIIVTHSYGNGRVGIRYLPNGLKVYHIPLPLMYQGTSFPTIIGAFPYLRNIFLREQIQLVHGHNAFSTLAYDSLLVARGLRLATCFTDHSLFGFADLSSIAMNKILKFSVADVDHVICVSNTSKENTVLRASLLPEQVSVIPNAVIVDKLIPDPQSRDPDYITIVILSRLVYRKGMDLLISVIPRICSQFPRVKFLIAGEGPKSIDLEQLREQYLLQDRVTLIGPVRHHEIRNVLIRGNIFLNTSLTEAFCMAILEAACCGLFVVSTNVGGIPEVLPPDMIALANPNEDDLVFVISKTIDRIRFGEIDTSSFNSRIARMYSWENVASRTEQVYSLCFSKGPVTLLERMKRFYGCGAWFGKMLCMMIVFHHLIILLMDWIWPRNLIDPANKISVQK